jgi:hypothetical protein
MSKPQSRAVAVTQWSAPVLLAAPLSIWTANTLRGDTIEIMLAAIVVAFFAAQMAHATIIVATSAWRSAAAICQRRQTWVRQTIASVLSLHLGVRLQFVWMLTLSAAIWSWVLFALVPTASDSIEIAMVAAVAGLLATIGWMFSSYITARNTQRQNTITLLLNLRHSDVYSRHFNNAFFVSKLPDNKRNDRKAFAALDEQAKWMVDNTPCAPTDHPQSATTVRSAYQSVIYVLNYYEFIAAGVRRGALDAGIVRSTVSAHVHWALNAFRAWIQEERSDAGSAKPYEHLLWYCRKFPTRA